MHDPGPESPTPDPWRSLPIVRSPAYSEEGSFQPDDELAPQPNFSGLVLPLSLFSITIFMTLWAGAYHTNTNPFHGPVDFLMKDPWALWKGIPFSATLLGILVTHEFGHYVFARVHRVPATLPLFIPGPPHFVGTFGAIIRMRGPILSRKALFDIGVAGPIAGFVVALIALIVGLSQASVVPLRTTYGLQLGEPLLLQFLAWMIIGPLPVGTDIVLGPVGFAAWFGLFITSLNLIPIGQLDGGHVAYALWGGTQRTLALGMVPVLFVLGFIGWPGWYLWAMLGMLFGLGHPPIQDPHVRLGRSREIVGWCALAIFLLTFVPIPFTVG